MQEYKIGLNGLNCASCEKIVGRVAAANNAQVKEIDEHTGYVTVVCEENVLDTLKKQFAEKGFVERKIDDSERGDLSRVLNYFSSILSGGQEVIVESTLFGINVELSQGSHFFHNLSSFNVSYFSLNYDGEFAIDWEWLNQQKVVRETNFIKHVKLESPLKIKVDGKTSRGVIKKC
ncbi:MAG TPA: hypothetical protein HA254_03105 [Candidatus Diapherotrites archaeon]|uniref:HMA domain-containing protein n=1 Tax=Candidatus Iainarchaeum sp. TaxID=3101447 RepID=A0A7J4J314_9ARCH|nr:hypothetical protein [Candidatus Diapherotrites archaeon]